MRRVLIASAIAMIAGFPAVAESGRQSYDSLRYAGVARQTQEPSCAAASVVTILNNRFGERLDEGEVWLNYVGSLPPAQQRLALSDGLSLADIGRLVARLGYKVHIVRIGLLDLAKTGQPAVLYLERRGPRPMRHFLVFERLDGSYAVLRDPALGNRRVHVQDLLEQWQGHAVFITRPGSAAAASPQSSPPWAP